MTRHTILILVLLTVLTLGCARIERGESLVKFPDCPPGMNCQGAASFQAGPLGIDMNATMSFHGDGPSHPSATLGQPEPPTEAVSSTEPTDAVPE